jgi:ATP-dependent Zn protease
MKRVVVVTFLIVAMSAILQCKAISAQDNSSTVGNQSPVNSSNIQGNGNAGIQREGSQKDQLASNSNIEQQKLDLEHKKLEVERTKAWWAAVSTIVPLLAALGTLSYSVWSFRRQTKQTNTKLSSHV